MRTPRALGADFKSPRLALRDGKIPASAIVELPHVDRVLIRVDISSRVLTLMRCRLAIASGTTQFVRTRVAYASRVLARDIVGLPSVGHELTRLVFSGRVSALMRRRTAIASGTTQFVRTRVAYASRVRASAIVGLHPLATS